MRVKLLSKYNSEFLIEVIRFEFVGKGLLNSFLNLKHWSATLVIKYFSEVKYWNATVVIKQGKSLNVTAKKLLENYSINIKTSKCKPVLVRY